MNTHVSRFVHHRHGHRRRQDVCRRADRRCIALGRKNELASTSRWPAAASCAMASSFRRMPSPCGKRPADRGRSSKSARSGSPRRWLLIWPHGPRAGGSTRQLLRDGIDFWRETSDIVLVEGAGGLMSPMSDDDYNADLAAEFGYPLVVVAANVLGHDQRHAANADHGQHVLRRPRRWPASCSIRRPESRTIPARTAIATNWPAAACHRCWPRWSTAAGSIARSIGGKLLVARHSLTSLARFGSSGSVHDLLRRKAGVGYS